MGKLPIQCIVKEDVDKCKTIKVTYTDVDSNICKGELPIFTNNVPHKLLLVLLEDIPTMADCFELFEAIKGNRNPKGQLGFQHFRRALNRAP